MRVEESKKYKIETILTGAFGLAMLALAIFLYDKFLPSSIVCAFFAALAALIVFARLTSNDIFARVWKIAKAAAVFAVIATVSVLSALGTFALAGMATSGSVTIEEQHEAIMLHVLTAKYGKLGARVAMAAYYELGMDMDSGAVERAENFAADMLFVVYVIAPALSALLFTLLWQSWLWRRRRKPALAMPVATEDALSEPPEDDTPTAPIIRVSRWAPPGPASKS